MDKDRTVAVYSDISSLTENEAVILKELIKPHMLKSDAKLRNDSVCARALLKYILSKYFGVDNFLIDSDENGKPYILNSDLHFNMSHSSDMVFCAVSYAEIGCDVQAVKEFNPKISKRFFTDFEDVLLLESTKQDRLFTKLWTLKESVLKQKGVGLSGGLSSYDFSAKLYEDDFSAFGLFFKTFFIKDYCFSVCSQRREVAVCEADIKCFLSKNDVDEKGEYYELYKVHQK